MQSEPDIDLEKHDQPVDEAPEAVEAPAPEMDAPANSATEDSVLDRLLGIDDPAPRRDDSTPEATAPASDPEMDRALKALQRDGVPASVIDGLKANPSSLKEWGLKAAKRQADVDSYGSRLAEAKKTDAAKEAARPSVDASVKSEDKEADADPLSQFKDIFGDEAAKPIAALAERIRGEFAEKHRALEVKYETQSAYQRIASEYGKDAPSFDEITDVAARVGRENPGKFSSISEIVREAFVQRAGQPRRSDPRDIARPSVGKQPPRPVKQVDREDTILSVLLSGGSRDDAIKAATR